MIKLISTWKPWNLGKIADAVRILDPIGDHFALKTVNASYLYGMNSWTRLTFGGDQVDFENALKEKGNQVSSWIVPYFKNWAVEADRIREANDLFNPVYTHWDIERFHGYSGVDSNGYLLNVGAFIRRVGRLPGTKTFFQGPRRIYAFRNGSWIPYHPEVRAEKFLSYTDQATGEYIIDGIGAQLYPIGWNGTANFIDQTRMDVDSQEELLRRVGRPGLPYFPTLAAFPERGWAPTVDELDAQIEYLKDRLGDRLIGINFWTSDWISELPDIWTYIRDLDLGENPAPDPPGEDPSEWISKAERFRQKTIQNVEDIVALDPGSAPEV